VYGFADELETISVPILDNVYEELKTLGTFTDYDAKPSANPPSPGSGLAVATVSDNRIALLEGKLQFLDEKIVALNDRLDNLSQNRNERDEIVVELFKMLKDNLDKRWQLFSQLENTNTQEENHAADTNSASSSKVSSLRKHKQKKN
jgi:hypothetical protein